MNGEDIALKILNLNRQGYNTLFVERLDSEVIPDVVSEIGQIFGEACFSIDFSELVKRVNIEYGKKGNIDAVDLAEMAQHRVFLAYNAFLSDENQIYSDRQVLRAFQTAKVFQKYMKSDHEITSSIIFISNPEHILYFHKSRFMKFDPKRKIIINTKTTIETRISEAYKNIDPVFVYQRDQKLFLGSSGTYDHAIFSKEGEYHDKEL